MLGSQALETAIGLALVFGTLSLIASGLRETIEALLQTRAIGLERGVREMLADPEGTGLARALFAHPLIAGLYRGSYDPARLHAASGDKRLPLGSRLPAYVPASDFAAALIDVVIGPASPSRNLTAIPSGLARLTGLPIATVVGSALAESGGDIGLLRERIERWYDSTMERVSGWYRKQTQLILFAIGLALAVGCNVDALAMARDFYTGEAVRSAIVAEAEGRGCGTTACAERRIAAIPLPIGWRAVPRAVPWGALPGWLLTALAIAVGAPFWFYLLDRLMVVRSTVKPRGDSPPAPFEPHAWAARADPHEGVL